MPSSVGVIDILTTPPLVSLQQVLDTNGPFGAGDHTISSFHTNGAFLLPSGTYPISGTYGVLVQPSTFPATAGRLLGWNDASFPTASGDYYLDRIAQLVQLRQFPISGAFLPMEYNDCHHTQDLFLWSAFLQAPDKIGLHVFPNFSVDLFWMCVL